MQQREHYALFVSSKDDQTLLRYCTITRRDDHIFAKLHWGKCDHPVLPGERIAVYPTRTSTPQQYAPTTPYFKPSIYTTQDARLRNITHCLNAYTAQIGLLDYNYFSATLDYDKRDTITHRYIQHCIDSIRELSHTIDNIVDENVDDNIDKTLIMQARQQYSNQLSQDSDHLSLEYSATQTSTQSLVPFMIAHTRQNFKKYTAEYIQQTTNYRQQQLSTSPVPSR